MPISIFQIDAFTDKPFSGNPAAVCLLDQEGDPACMQAVGAEMNLAETAFVRPLNGDFELRWFTPTIEVDLCGHATLAAAHALWSEGVVHSDQPIRFETRSGLLAASKIGDFIKLDFPATPPEECEPPPGLLEALNLKPIFLGKTKFDYFLVADTADEVRSLQPGFRRLAEIPTRGVIVTSRSDDPQFDFISRFFAPAAGIDEDPVTGSAHCSLGPYWSEQLGKKGMTGFQASARGGVVRVAVKGERVILSGQAVTVFKGAFV